MVFITRDCEPDEERDRLYDYKETWITTQEFNNLLEYTTLEVNCPYCEGCFEYSFSHADAFDVAMNGNEKQCVYCNEMFYVSWEGEYGMEPIKNEF